MSTVARGVVLRGVSKIGGGMSRGELLERKRLLVKPGKGSKKSKVQ